MERARASEGGRERTLARQVLLLVLSLSQLAKETEEQGDYYIRNDMTHHQPQRIKVSDLRPVFSYREREVY
jgi:hypothetical protein